MLFPVWHFELPLEFDGARAGRNGGDAGAVGLEWGADHEGRAGKKWAVKNAGGGFLLGECGFGLEVLDPEFAVVLGGGGVGFLDVGETLDG